MTAYYNENDPQAAAWLRTLIGAGEIAPGDVDERSIEDVRADEIRKYTQHHFFAGIGGWSLGLRLAGWPDDRPVWTGSCPCPPFSAAGKGSECPSCGGRSCLAHPVVTAGWLCLDCGDEWRGDVRHLLPEFIRLIGQCQPANVFGEQVASRDGRLWLYTLRATLEALGYAVGAADLCAAGVGAPHIRQRLWFVVERLADTERGDGRREHGHGLGRAAREGQGKAPERERFWADPTDGGATVRLEHTTGDGRHERRAEPGGRGVAGGCGGGRMADTIEPRLEGHSRDGDRRREPGRIVTHSNGPTAPKGSVGRVADADSDRRDETGSGEYASRNDGPERDDFSSAGQPATSAVDGFWRDADWLFCRDGKWRPVEPGSFPLADGVPHRVGLLRGYGNAICPQAAAAFITAYSGG